MRRAAERDRQLVPEAGRFVAPHQHAGLVIAAAAAAVVRRGVHCLVPEAKAIGYTMHHQPLVRRQGRELEVFFARSILHELKDRVFELQHHKSILRLVQSIHEHRIYTILLLLLLLMLLLLLLLLGLGRL